MAQAACRRAADVCRHPNGEPCRKPVSVTVKSSYSLGDGRFSPETETRICEQGWKKVQQVIGR
jgi:hypothetical protein